MRRRYRSIGAVAVVIAVVAPARVPVAGETQSSAAKSAVKSWNATKTATTWTPLRTPWGNPDLEGVWNNGTITPLERPSALAGRDVLTTEERAELDQEAATRADRRPANAVADLELAYNAVWWDRGKSIGRTSLIVDPPDGRLPPLTREGQKRRDARVEAQRARGPADSWEDRPYQERCLLYHGVPPIPTGYNNNYQIIQTPGYVTILYEMLHEARLIPMDGRSHLAQGLRQWMGDPRGHWDGETLVVETTNFSDRIDSFRYANTSLAGSFPVASETLRVVERFRRVSADTIDYQFTIYDPTTYTKPWTATLPMTKTAGLLYEYACHEGNYSLVFVLGGHRAEEKAAEAAAKKGSR